VAVLSIRKVYRVCAGSRNERALVNSKDVIAGASGMEERGNEATELKTTPKQAKGQGRKAKLYRVKTVLKTPVWNASKQKSDQGKGLKLWYEE
jgi:hypothetical protein